MLADMRGFPTHCDMTAGHIHKQDDIRGVSTCRTLFGVDGVQALLHCPEPPTGSLNWSASRPWLPALLWSDAWG